MLSQLFSAGIKNFDSPVGWVLFFFGRVGRGARQCAPVQVPMGLRMG